MAMGLTRQQGATLEFVEGYITDCGCSPSFDEIREHLGLCSKSGVHRILGGLEERGRLTWKRNAPRSIRLLAHRERYAHLSPDEIQAEIVALHAELMRRRAS